MRIVSPNFMSQQNYAVCYKLYKTTIILSNKQWKYEAASTRNNMTLMVLKDHTVVMFVK